MAVRLTAKRPCRSLVLSTATAGLLLAETSARAGDLEVGFSSNGILFRPGRYAEFNTAHSLPSVDGVLGNVTIPNIGGNVNLFSGGIKTNIGARFDVAFQARETIQLDVTYPDDPALGPLQNLRADLNAASFQLLGRYRLNDAFSVFGGPRYQTATGEAFLMPNEAILERDGAFGFTAGLAYENPAKRFRAILSYQSEINHLNETVSTLPGVTTVSQSTPRSIALSLRAPVAPKTIAFGRVRWSHSDSANVSVNNSVVGTVVESDFRNTFTVAAGLNRRVTKRLAVRVVGSHRTGNGEPTGNVFPTNGRTSLELGGRYALTKKVDLSAAFRHTWIGDAVAISGAQFENNRALLFRSGISFRF